MKSWQIAIIGAAVVVVAVVGIFALQSSTGKVVATVNGVAIPESEVDKQIEQVEQQQPNVFDGPAGKEEEKRYRESALDYLISAELIAQEAEKQGVTVPDSEIQTKLDEIKKIFPGDKEYEQALKEQGLTEEGLRDKIYEQAIAEKMLKEVTGKIKISDKELKDFYEKNKDQITEPEQKKWRHIVVKKKSKAEELLEELKNGADFGKLAKKNSIDKSTKDAGGDLGFHQDDDFPPEIAQALRKVNINELSEIIKSADGFHIYQLEEVKASRKRAFDEVEDQIKANLEREKQTEKFSAWLEKEKKKATIKKSG